MSENQVEEKKGWSWLGFFFAPYYYAGYGDLKKGAILAIFYAIPFVALLAGVYGGLKAKKELPIKQQDFKWTNVALIVFLTIIISALVQYSINGSDSESPVKIEAKLLVTNMLGFEQKIPVVEVISISDVITIENVIANNGNCKMSSHRQKEFPKTLKYGQKATAGYSAKCNLIKVEIITDKGNWSKEFDYIPEEISQF